MCVSADQNDKLLLPLPDSNQFMRVAHTVNSGDWLNSMRYYLLTVTLLNGVWEVVQLPLYTLWHQGSTGAIIFAVLHCTLGDAMIASSSLLLALLFFGSPAWPKQRFWRVACSAILIGVCYTVYSEWKNTTISQSWAYSSLMPSVFGIGLAPLAQWLVIPSGVFWWIAKRPALSSSDR
jgi:hypothetical protein